MKNLTQNPVTDVEITGPVTVSNEVEVKNDSGNPIPIEDAGGSITVDGPLTDTELRATAVPVDGSGVTQPVSAASLPLPTGAATEAKQDTLIGHVDGVEGLLGTIDADTGSIDGKLPALSSGRVPVDGSGVTQPVSVSGVVDTITGLEIPAHDYIDLSYTGANLTSVVYKDGGSGGTTVATLTLAYDGNDNLTSVTKS